MCQLSRNRRQPQVTTSSYYAARVTPSTITTSAPWRRTPSASASRSKKIGSISERIRQECGHEDVTYATIFRSITVNKQNTTLQDGRMVATNTASFIFPACLKAKDWLRGMDAEPLKFTLPEAMSIGSVASSIMGAERNTALYKERVNDIYRDNLAQVTTLQPGNSLGRPLSALEKITFDKGQEIQLRVVIEPTALRLDLSRVTRSEFLSQMLAATRSMPSGKVNPCGTSGNFLVPLQEQNIAVLPETAKQTRSLLLTLAANDTQAQQFENLATSPRTVAPPHGMRYCSERNTEPLAGTVSGCDGTVGAGYPINWTVIKEAIAVEENLRKPSEIVPTVVIADTGLIGLDDVDPSKEASFPPALPSEFFKRVRPKDYGQDTIGLKLSAPGDARYQPPYVTDYPGGDVDHGTHIAGILLGQGDPQIRDSIMRNRLKILIVNLVSSPKVDSDLCLRRSHIEPDDIVKAVHAAEDLTKQTSPSLIFNMSLETYDKVGGNPEALLEKHLVVAAAGNSGHDYNKSATQAQPGVWPAAWVRETQANVITVGGHDAGRTMPIGNFGREEVDILAPACKIRSLIDTSHFGEKSGTSQAAAFVSLAAALIKKYQEDWTPSRIKNRLIASSDYVRALRETNVAGGVLNPGASVAVHFDVLKMRNNEVRFGWIRSEEIRGCSDGAVSQLRLGDYTPFERISYEYEASGSLPSRIITTRRRDHTRHDCQMPAEPQRQTQIQNQRRSLRQGQSERQVQSQGQDRAANQGQNQSLDLDETQGQTPAGDYVEFERHFLVEENGKEVVKMRMEMVPYKDILEIVPVPEGGRPQS